ncbi:MmgE/PrpD family protein [Streptomyces sp. NPDC005507]|uniref:MmgE/PrpD family protein n=1 Tax=unclassified Streptomyces TaxID=2593676 RepID=UPI00339EDB7C
MISTTLPRNSVTVPDLIAAISPFAVGRRDRSGGAANEDVVASALILTARAAISGVDDADVQALLRWIDDEPVPGTASVWGTGRWATPSLAAFVNGSAARVSVRPDGQSVHPGIVLIPALVARASVAPTDLRTVVEAFNVGRAVLAAVTEALAVPDARPPWNRPPLAGRLAATAAVARVAGLDEEQACCALATAATWGTASAADRASMVHALDAGLAARDAIISVSLAEHGFSGPGAPEPHAGEGEHRGHLAVRLRHWERAWADDLRHISAAGTDDAGGSADSAHDSAAMHSWEIGRTVRSGDLTQLQEVLA